MSTSPSKRNNSPDTATATVDDDNTDDAQQFQQIIRDRKGNLYIFDKFFQLIKEFLIFSPTHVICNYTLFDD